MGLVNGSYLPGAVVIAVAPKPLLKLLTVSAKLHIACK
jgi:hypothetical protein